VYTLQKRGSGNDNPIKLARCIREKERINGIRQGGDGSNQHVQTSNNFKSAPTQAELAEQLGISVQQLHNYKQLLKLIPEHQDLVESDDIERPMDY
jgi:ParB family chromosome partitioning protein